MESRLGVAQNVRAGKAGCGLRGDELCSVMATATAFSPGCDAAGCHHGSTAQGTGALSISSCDCVNPRD